MKLWGLFFSAAAEPFERKSKGSAPWSYSNDIMVPEFSSNPARDGDGTGIKAGHSRISGSVLQRWASPSGAPADCCRSSPAPPWVWAGQGRRHFTGSQTNQTLHFWYVIWYVIMTGVITLFTLWIVSVLQQPSDYRIQIKVTLHWTWMFGGRQNDLRGQIEWVSRMNIE